MRTPSFWQRRDWRSDLLLPAAGLWRLGTLLHRWAVRPKRVALPVICLGGVTVGGAGKTPAALAVARHLIARGRRPHFVTRGYGGTLGGPIRVDPKIHSATEVGDEALLLAAVAPCWVARDRRRGCAAAAVAGADCVILDDGLQNPSLEKDLAILCLDGPSGLGNGRLLPAGPLREPLDRALARTHAVLLIGDDRQDLAARLAPTTPLLSARLEPVETSRPWRGRRLYGFCGLGQPEKFFASLAAAGADIVGRRIFADHHPYRGPELAALAKAATEADAPLVTTQKDWVRLPEEWRRRVEVFEVTLRLAQPAALDALLAARLV